MLSVEGNSELIRARKDSHGLANLDPSSLEHLGLFNRIEMSPRQRHTTRLPPYCWIGIGFISCISSKDPGNAVQK